MRVPSYHNTGGKIFFAIELTKSQGAGSSRASLSSMRSSFQSSSASVEHRVTYRSYSQFRQLWKALADQPSPSLQRNALDRFRSRLSMVLADENRCCRCDGNQCRFQGIRQVMRVFPFPSRHVRCPKYVKQSKAMLNTRRASLENFIREVQAYFASFPESVLHDKLVDAKCTALQTFAKFVQADVHFPTTTGVSRQPLALQGWKQQCAEKMMIEDEESAGSEVSSCRDSRATLSSANMQKDIDLRASLPVLQVKTVKVETMYSFMEEFCDHVLSQYAHDIAELSSPDLTPARRWEICLYVACRIGHTYAVQLILFNYADADTCMADGSTCLHIAARMGHTDIVELLLEEGANVNQANDAGVTPLIAACRNGCVDVAKRLLHAGASIAACSSRGTYPLHAAIVSQNVEIVQLLVENGADVNVMTVSGITPLHFAAKLGSVEISEFLLHHQADVEQRTKNDSDAMMIASANGHATICELLQRFSQVNRRVGNGSDNSTSSSAKDDMSYLTRARQCSKAGEMVRLHSQRLTARQCA